MTEFTLVIVVFDSTKKTCEQALHLWGGGGGGGRGHEIGREWHAKGTRECKVRFAHHKMERLLRWLCSTQASGHLF